MDKQLTKTDVHERFVIRVDFYDDFLREHLTEEQQQVHRGTFDVVATDHHGVQYTFEFHSIPVDEKPNSSPRRYFSGEWLNFIRNYGLRIGDHVTFAWDDHGLRVAVA